MNKQSLTISMMPRTLLILLGLLSFVPSSQAQSGEGPCSNLTLRGDYGFSIEGQFLAGPLAGQQLRGVAMTHFDGEGNLSQVDHIVRNGVPPAIEWSPGSGTYAVNPDCTGTAQITFTDGRPPVNLHLVVVRQGTEVHTVVDANAATSIGIKRDSGIGELESGAQVSKKSGRPGRVRDVRAHTRITS